MDSGMSRRIKPKEKYVRISMKEVWRNLDGPSKNKEFVELRSDFDLSRPKVAELTTNVTLCIYGLYEIIKDETCCHHFMDCHTTDRILHSTIFVTTPFGTPVMED